MDPVADLMRNDVFGKPIVHRREPEGIGDLSAALAVAPAFSGAPDPDPGNRNARLLRDPFRHRRQHLHSERFIELFRLCRARLGAFSVQIKFSTLPAAFALRPVHRTLPPEKRKRLPFVKKNRRIVRVFPNLRPDPPLIFIEKRLDPLHARAGRRFDDQFSPGCDADRDPFPAGVGADGIANPP